MTGLPSQLGTGRWPVPNHPELEIADGESIFDEPVYFILKAGTDELAYPYLYRSREAVDFAAQHDGETDPD